VTSVDAVRIRTARPAEAAALSDLAMRSKAHWGYSAEFLEACRASLTVSPNDCDAGTLLVAEIEGQVAGFARLDGTPPEGELSDLWVDPAFMGRGVGRALFEAITARAARMGFRALLIDADPNAEAFYLHLGAVRIGEVPSTVIPGRTLPLLRFTL
jgi:ribosomal protein S18 acetylase RimI-like enzyme